MVIEPSFLYTSEWSKLSRVPASTHQHIDNGASDVDIAQFSTLFPQSIHIIMSSIHGLTI
jgi:hypothetical protein